MEELLNDFLAETADHLEQVGSQIVHFEQNPSDVSAIGNIFRLVHTIKGTCGFLDLSRLEKLAHAAENLIGLVRERGHAEAWHVSLILSSIDRIREIVEAIEANGVEPEGDDGDLIAALVAASLGEPVEMASPPVEPLLQAGAPAPDVEIRKPVAAEEPSATVAAVADSGRDERIALPGSSREPATIRVAIGTIERIMRLVSELVLTRNQLLELARALPHDDLAGPLQRLSGVTSDLQDGVMRARMQPIDRLFGPLPRMIRDLAYNLGKKAELVLEGSDTELDRQMIDLLRDPLTHIIRNCIDHGIEPPQERLALGKTDYGTLRISASHEAGHITLRIEDDGRGLDVDRIREKAMALGLAGPDELAHMASEELCRFIFSPGFSTARNVTNVSGRGVGMDVVRENIESIGGAVTLSTSRGRGTTFILKVPLTLAIAPALIFEVEGQRFAIPQHAVVEAVTCGESGQSFIQMVQGAPMLALRDHLLPVADMRTIFGFPPVPAKKDCLAIVARTGVTTFALTVDNVADVQEIVVKPLNGALSQLGLYAGSTILGDGSVVLIMNPTGLATRIGLDSSNQLRVDANLADLPPEKKATNLILFRAGAGALKALPLSLISRIESVKNDQLSASDGQLVMMHRNALMPVIDLCGSGNDRRSRDHWPVLVVGVGGEPMGLLVSEIVDIIESFLDIEIAGTTPAVIGSTTIRGEAAEVLDLAHFMKAARPGAFERGHARRFRVMLVDDKLFFRDLLAPVVSAAGYEVTTFASAAEALAAFKRGFGFDVVVTDIDMPEMDGYNFAQALLENERTRKIPIIALDAHAGSAVVDAAHQAGMRNVVGKFDRQALLTELRTILEASAFTPSALEQKLARDKAA
jgi:two-component system chemotaxis sensor kinase CheA